MLPHARVGGIAGLLELLQDRGGREDLYRLAEVLIMDAEIFSPLSKPARFSVSPHSKKATPKSLLTVLALPKPTSLPAKFSSATPLWNHVMILQQIDSILHAKTDHSISEEFFYDILDEHFSQDEVERQFETAMNWGRYAEIFDFDRESHRLVLAEPVSEPHPPTAPVQP